jgi:hypothetical protein
LHHNSIQAHRAAWYSDFFPLLEDSIRAHNLGSTFQRGLVDLVKDRRWRPEGGEWEPIKIPHRNLAYVPKLTRNRSLLTRSRPSSYRQAIGLRNWARNYNKDLEKTAQEIDNIDLTQKQFISSQAFHRTLSVRVRETTVGEPFRPQASRLSIRWLNGTLGIQPATNFTHKHPAAL